MDTRRGEIGDVLTAIFTLNESQSEQTSREFQRRVMILIVCAELAVSRNCPDFTEVSHGQRSSDLEHDLALSGGSSSYPTHTGHRRHLTREKVSSAGYQVGHRGCLRQPARSRMLNAV